MRKENSVVLQTLYSQDSRQAVLFEEKVLQLAHGSYQCFLWYLADDIFENALYWLDQSLVLGPLENHRKWEILDVWCKDQGYKSLSLFQDLFGSLWIDQKDVVYSVPPHWMLKELRNEMLVCYDYQQ